MFTQLNPANARRQRWLRIISLVVHGILLTWLLHTPEPQLLTANSVASGQNGKSVTRLYWPSKTPDESNQSSSDQATQRYRHQRLSHDKLTWTAQSKPPKLQAPNNQLARTNEQDNSTSQTLSALGHGAQAGALYGTLNNGPFSGNEIIEITIDERGEIVRKTVLQSLGPDIDDKCLAALENWHFRPATRNGTAIMSKQDAIFPFKARG